MSETRRRTTEGRLGAVNSPASLRVQLPTAPRTHHERIRGAVVVVGSYVQLLGDGAAWRTNAIRALSQLSYGPTRQVQVR
jgi:hypothetical protein